jgi:hypothetical protein
MNTEKQNLDDLLAKLPLPSGERLDVSTEGRLKDSKRWENQLEQTLARIKAERVETPLAVKPRPDFSMAQVSMAQVSMDDVLRTPLPLEAGEPDPNRLSFDGAATDTVKGFDGIFEGESLDSDPLRAPLKSGEHAHFRPAVTPVTETETPTKPATSTGKRRFILVLGSATTMLAAAAAVALFLRTEPNVKELSTVAAAPVEANHAVPATDQPKPENLDGLKNAAANVNSEVPKLRADSETATAQVPPHAMKTASARVAKGIAKSAEFDPLAPRPAAASAPKEPALMPASGPNELPDHPTMGAVMSAYSKRQAEAKRCLPSGESGAKVSLSFVSSGKVTRVTVLPTSLAPTVQACVFSALSAVQVEPFARTHYEVTLSL